LRKKNKTEPELQADLEEERSWVRNVNNKLYDEKLKKLIQDSSNGYNFLN
jgi:hypothetical protein